MITNQGTYTQYPSLAALPQLVRVQRRVESAIAQLEPFVEQDKALRKEIDALLVGAGLASGDLVTCNGYDVKHHERKGQSSLNQEEVVAQLVAAGVDRALVEQVLLDSVETGDPSKFATVKPSKGSKVRKS